MTQNLKIEVLTGDISIDGMVVTNLVTKEELSTAIVKKADLGTDGKIPTSQLPAEIVNTAGIVDEVKLQLETSIKDAVDESNAYAESYTDNALSSKADLTSGKVPLEQLPAIDQYPQFGTALSNLSTSILTSVKQRTDQLEKSKADLGEDGKVLREQIPSYEKISGLPEQLEVMSTQTAAVSGELDEYKLQTADQIDTLKENINTNSEFLIESMTERLENYADKDAVKRGIANRYDSSLTYNSGERVVLTNGDIVKSTIADNTANPNVDMTGWGLVNSDSQIKTWSGRTQEEKNKDIIHAKDFGLIGLGDETQKIKDLVAYAKQNKSLIVLGGQATYSFSGLIDIDNVKIFTNGATFSRLDAGGGWSIDIGANTNITELKLQVAGGIGQYGVRIKDNNVNIGGITATASNQATYGFRCGFTSKLKNVKVGRIELVNFISQAQIFNTKNCKFGDIVMESYVTGLYVQDGLNLKIDSITATVCDTVNATGGAGNNGLLVESLSHRATRNLTIGSIHIEDSAEHGVRFGGFYTIEDVFIGDVYTKNTGSLVGVSTGGNSFKILGSRPDGAVGYNLHKNFHINSITSVDCQTAGVGIGNHVALNLGWCERVYIGTHVVKKENAAYSCWRAVQFQGCSNIHIQNVDYDYCRDTTVRFTAMGVPEMEQDAWEFCSNINIYSGKIVQRSLGNGAIYFTGTVVKYTNININASVTADILSRAEALTATGLYSKIRLNLVSNHLSSTTPSVSALQLPNTTDAFICNISGKFYNGSCSDGSTWTDPNDTIVYRNRANGAWLNADRSIRSYTVADDAVLQIKPPASQGIINIMCGTSFQYASIAFRLFAAANISKIAGSANINVLANTIPTGTTGTDGFVTVCTSTDGNIYIENRLGTLNKISVSFS